MPAKKKPVAKAVKDDAPKATTSKAKGKRKLEDVKDDDNNNEVNNNNNNNNIDNNNNNIDNNNNNNNIDNSSKTINKRSKGDNELNIDNNDSNTNEMEISINENNNNNSIDTTNNNNDKIKNLALEYWSIDSKKGFNESIIKKIYIEEICKGHSQYLEFSGYLENFLWKYFNEKSSVEHIESIIILINEKFRDSSIQVFDQLTIEPDKFQIFFELIVTSYLSFHDNVSLIIFLINVYRSLENVVVRKCALKYVNIPIWESLSSLRIKEELESSPAIKKHWESYLLQNKQKKNLDGVWIPNLIKNFMQIVEKNALSNLKYIERFAELLIDLLSQLPTRRFLNTVIDNFQLVIRCKKSSFINYPELLLFNQLLDTIDSYVHFEINDHTGKALTVQDRMSLQSEKIHKLQQLAFTDYKVELRDLIFSSLGELGKVDVLERYLKLLDDSKLIELAEKIGCIPPDDKLPSLALDFIVSKTISRKSKTDELNRLSLYPNEKLLWDENQVPMINDYNGSQVYSLPKLNLQFLTVHDYLLRNFILYRLESAYQIREDIVDAVKRMGPKSGLRGTVFAGWARMALQISSVSIDEVILILNHFFLFLLIIL